MSGTSNSILDFLIYEHFELTGLVLILFLTGAQKLYSLFRIRKHPELKEGYPKAIYGFLVFMGLPNLIIAIGVWVFGFSGINFMMPSLRPNNILDFIGNKNKLSRRLIFALRFARKNLRDGYFR